MMKTAFFAICAAFLFAACKKDPEPVGAVPAAPAPQPPPPPAAPPLSSVAPANLPMALTWEDPSGWERRPVNNPMRKATYRVPKVGSDTEDAELAVFYFGPGQGGGIDANVDRWVKQFSGVPGDAVKRADRHVNGLRQHTIEIEKGTFSSGMPGGPTTPKPGYGLLGGIIETPSGAYFFKLTGPSATVTAAKTTFYKLLDSAKSS